MASVFTYSSSSLFNNSLPDKDNLNSRRGMKRSATLAVVHFANRESDKLEHEVDEDEDEGKI